MSNARLDRNPAQYARQHLELLLRKRLLADEVLVRDIQTFLLKAPLRPTDVFEELRTLNIGSALLATKTDHLLRLLGTEPKGLQLRLLSLLVCPSLCLLGSHARSTIGTELTSPLLESRLEALRLNAAQLLG